MATQAMNIYHHIALPVTPKAQVAFREAGVSLQLAYESFDIDEEDPRWEKVARLIARFNSGDLVWTRFSPAELDAARYLTMDASWYHGYPEPADDFGYLQATFDLTNYCETCGIGARQIAPFRFKKAPNWGTRSILQLNWVFDEYFVKPDVWAAVFKPLAIECLPVVLHRNGVELETVVQLAIQTIVDVRVDGLPYETCSRCGRKKYLPFTRGFTPRPEPTETPIFKSRQYFGSGASASRMVMIANHLYRAIREARLRGFEFRACAE